MLSHGVGSGPGCSVQNATFSGISLKSLRADGVLASVPSSGSGKPTPSGSEDRIVRNLVRRAAAVIAVVGGTLSWSGVAPAAADPWGIIVLATPDDKWKASAWYHDDTNEICIRAHNSLSSAYAEIWVRDNWMELIRHFRDYGGNDEPTCRTVSTLYNGDVGHIYFQHKNSDGIQTVDYQGNVTF